jgi:hypothetical protein
MICSCNPTQRAINKVNAVNKRHPEVLANFCRDTFPCVTIKVDTLIKYDTTYTAIKFDYDSIPTDTIWLTYSRTQLIDKTVYIASIGEVKTIFKTIKDSAKIRSCELELKDVNKKLNESTALNTKLQNKITGRNSAIMWLIIALLCSIIINVILIKKW